MKKYNIIKLFFRYLFDYKEYIIYFILVGIIFTIILSLYSISLEPLLYAYTLSGVAGLILLTLDFIKYIKRYTTLDMLKKSIIYSVDSLPKANNIIEKSCFEIIETIQKDSMDFKYQVGKHQYDMIDYYTMWIHQVKTPISAMRLLLQTDTSENSKELQNELFKIEQYVEMILSYLRIDSTSTDFLIKQYNLNDILKQSIRKFSKPFILKKISINLEDISLKVITDEKWICFVIEQILSNSLKYTNTGGYIHIFVKSNSLYIQDNGIGISQEDLPRIFDKGFTGYNGRLNKKSTGIGLYLCRKILTKLNHKIDIKSKIGIGTTVIIDFNTYANIKD